nr:unnamed protein product [Callosobruchus chinensis]
MKRCDGEHDRYSETDLDIRAVEWNPTETGFVACTGKNEVLYFTFKRTSLSLQSRCSLDSAVPICVVLNWGSEDTLFQGAGAERRRAEGTNTSPLIEEINDKYIAWQTLKPVIYRSPHNATVVVIDGKFLEFSKFDQCITPPPCFYTQLEHQRPINEIYSNLNSKLCMIIDSHFQTTIFDYSGEDIHPVFVSKDPKLTSIANIKYVDWTDNDFVKITIDTDINSIIDHEDNGFRQACITKKFNVAGNPPDNSNSEIYRVTLFKDISLPPKVILYQERGNLEVIRSAMVTIDYIEELVNEGKWSIAMQVMRNERINWNVLIELNPDKVLSSIEEFVIAARGTELLVAILQDLNVKECVLNTIYKNLMITPVDVPTSVKLSFIDAILTYLIDADCAKSVLDAAYNLHDLEFVLFVYQCSSEDPRVYEQEIAGLKRLNNMAHLKFEMCLKGNNPKEAVKYLLRCDEFDEDFIENFIMRLKVEKEAYSTVDSCHLYYFQTIRLYAKALSKERKYKKQRSYTSEWIEQRSLDEHILDLDWREVIRLMAVLNFDDAVKPKVLDKLPID